MAEYIDREKLKEAFGTDAQHSLSYFSDSLFELLLLEIDEMPAADVAPVVHGRWETRRDEFGAYYICSVCGCYIQLCREIYCPNCGAKMDLEGTE